MSTQALTKSNLGRPVFFDDFFRPWNEWFGESGLSSSRTFTIPPVNITEVNGSYHISLAVPGMKKEDFSIAVDANMLTISCEKSEEKSENENTYTRKEYNYTSFSRSFTIPEEVNKSGIEAVYQNGELTLNLPKKEETKKPAATNIAVK